MKILDKIKNALFEEEEQEEEVIAKKIDVEKTIEEKEKPKEEIRKDLRQEVDENDEDIEVNAKEVKKSPVLFDDEDFLSDTKELNFKEVPKKEEKILYGGFEVRETKENKDKFRPSPVISPVYGIVNTKNLPKDKVGNENSEVIRASVIEPKKSISLEEVRQKAFGISNQVSSFEEVKEDYDDYDDYDEDPILYDMKEDDKPAIEKITIGDAEEYFKDLGLEYEVDYKDLNRRKMTRTKRNEDLSDMISEEIKEEEKIKEERALNIDYNKYFSDETLENDLFKELEEDDKPNNSFNFINDTEEKNLYDLIDMMYDGKE